MRFATRTFLLSVIPFALVLSVAFYSAQTLTTSALKGELRASLRQSQRAIAGLRSKSEEENRRLLRIIGENAPIKTAMQLVLLEPGSADATRTLEDQLSEACGPLDLGFLAASRPDGTFLAGVIRQGRSCVAFDSTHFPLPLGRFLRLRGAAYSVASLPLSQGGEEIGSLAVGRRFELADLAMPAVLALGGRILDSTVARVNWPDLERGLEVCRGRLECETRIAGHNYLCMTLDAEPGRGDYSLFSLQDLDAATGPIAVLLRRIFLGAGIGALAAALLVSLLSSRSIVKPLSAMIARLRESERSAMLAEHPAGTSLVKEIQELTGSFNRAAASIRQGRDDLQMAYLEFVGALANALDARDPYTAGHSQRVSEYACAIAVELGVPPEGLNDIRIGALLHDIGKIGIGDAVLQKPGKLSGAEYALIREHPTIGRRILEGVHGFRPYLPIVELHHENWDGSGYPRGLRGEEVPAGARIVHVADAYDAMTSHRPYRSSMSPRQAFQILERFAGSQFDPEAVRAFARIAQDRFERPAGGEQAQFAERDRELNTV